jgi:hypothetical protein
MNNEHACMRLVLACMKSDYPPLANGEPEIVKWVFECCGLYDRLKIIAAALAKEGNP